MSKYNVCSSSVCDQKQQSSINHRFMNQDMGSNVLNKFYMNSPVLSETSCTFLETCYYRAQEWCLVTSNQVIEDNGKESER